MKYEQRKLGSAQSSTKYCVNEKTIITSKQKQTNEEQDNTVRITDGHITISECSDNLKTQNVENVHQGEITKKNANISALIAVTHAQMPILSCKNAVTSFCF